MCTKPILGHSSLSQHPSSPIQLIPNPHPNPSPPIPIHLHPYQPIQMHPNPFHPIPTTSCVCILLGCLRMCDNASWQNFANMRYQANLIMTTRTASKLCARSWYRDGHIFDLDLISPILSEHKNLHLYVCRTLILARLRFCVCALFYYTYTLSHSSAYTGVNHMHAFTMFPGAQLCSKSAGHQS